MLGKVKLSCVDGRDRVSQPRCAQEASLCAIEIAYARRAQERFSPEFQDMGKSRRRRRKKKQVDGKTTLGSG